MCLDDPYYGGPWPTGGGISPGGPILPGLGPLPGGTLLGNRPRCEPGRELEGYRQVPLFEFHHRPIWFLFVFNLILPTQVGTRMRLRRIYVKRYLVASSLTQCERECSTARDFRCISFNF